MTHFQHSFQENIENVNINYRSCLNGKLLYLGVSHIWESYWKYMAFPNKWHSQICNFHSNFPSRCIVVVGKNCVIIHPWSQVLVVFASLTNTFVEASIDDEAYQEFLETQNKLVADYEKLSSEHHLLARETMMMRMYIDERTRTEGDSGIKQVSVSRIQPMYWAANGCVPCGW